MNTQSGIQLTNLSLSSVPPQVSLGILKGPEHEALTELIANLALFGSFHLIAGSEWLPNQDDLRRSVRRYTTAVKETLDHPTLGRPSTCLQMLDQLRAADMQDCPILVLDFLHFFYDPDVDLILRQRVLEQCCRHVQILSRSKSVLLLVQCLPIDEYQLFFSILASVANEILEAREEFAEQSTQLSLFGAG